MTEIITPITNNRNLPENVPLVASFNDDRNRLSYYHPLIKNLAGVRTPLTQFYSINGSTETIPTIDCRPITEFMQEISITKAFIRGDFSSGKLSQDARIIQSQDPAVIKEGISKLIENLIYTERHLGGRIAVREHIPHNTEIRFFIRDGEIYYHEELDDYDVSDLPIEQVNNIAIKMSTYAWSVDFIQHKKTGKWYCIDMGLDGLYYQKQANKWIAISEHPDKDRSPEQYADEMPHINSLKNPY